MSRPRGSLITGAALAAALLLLLPGAARAHEEQDHDTEHKKPAAVAAAAPAPAEAGEGREEHHEEEGSGHVHDEHCQHGTPWERVAVGRAVRADSAALVILFITAGAGGVVTRRRNKGKAQP